ncbi:hypothetical protein ASPVEDRAFT_82804 [Aspergillus versicolor CBS 583.65]|uniref:Peptidase S8/S53 domain-containing protein n=1 Tax=Aspergillus versicolor CBS 583.65 TaxID=1036611 RepID=A0A1L9PIB7_ASPVE|nr:uncharacterized protein ASPVEDRAFT_82804 [Aspergillus versicolor CBS 583.65]OJJ01280.1 hypothetical protein ASPVEDRAFT_82804 [Aspergillus versicolor CBS 583.65]
MDSARDLSVLEGEAPAQGGRNYGEPHAISATLSENQSDSDDKSDGSSNESDMDEEEKSQRYSNKNHSELEEIVTSIKAFKKEDWADIDTEKAFGENSDRWPNLGVASETRGDTVLHMLITTDYENDRERENLVKAIQCTIQFRPELWTRHNSERATPLYLALTSPNAKRIDLLKQDLFISRPSRNTIDRALLGAGIAAACTAKKDNCLHLALKHRIHSTSLLTSMIKYASPDAVNATEKNNWTPLHRAAKYEHSSSGSLKIIKALIARGESGERTDDVSSGCAYALDTYVQVDNEELSVYQYHMKTREEMRPPPATSSRQANKPSRKESSKAEKNTRGPNRSVGNSQQTPTRDRANIGAIRTAAETQEEPREEELLNPGLRRSSTMNMTTEGKPSATAGMKKESTSRDKDQGKLKLEKYSEEIRSELKLHCLRTRSVTQALYFDYRGLPTENADPTTFYDNFQQTRFDEVLQYVEFPTVHLRQTQDPRGETIKQLKEVYQSNTRGRKDLLFFFSWLKDKKVKHIINLIVEDTKDSHADDAIEACLSGLRVDVLDWSKPDLDPEMLYSACPDVRELHLYWGGNNAILRAWAEPAGLPMLKSLERIYLYYDQSCHRSNTKVDDFIKRIQTPLPVPDTAGPKASTEEVVSEPVKKSKRSADLSTKIKVIPKQAPALDMDGREGAGITASAEGHSTSHSTVTVHKWLKSIDKFTIELKALMANIWRASHMSDEIRVALIDDGVDLLEKEFRERILHGKSFAAYGHDRNQREKQWYVSDRGHGTVMAHMILSVCPMAKIYPIRLETTRDPRTQSSRILPESAIRAIEAAVAKDVHVISMSWTVEPPKGKTKTEFDKVLAMAEEKNILMFCSSPDEGNFASDHYPTAWGPDKLFRIGASQADGHAYGLVQWNNVDYIFPGVDVVRANNRHIRFRGLDDDKSCTGSSVSTALASGLAALILWLAIIGAKYSLDAGQMDVLNSRDVSRLRDVKAMKQAFKNLGAGQSPHGKFVEIWSVLEKPCSGLKEHRGKAPEDIEKSRQIIFNLARDLVTKS